MIYQSLLTSVPIKRGNLFNFDASPYPKPKLSQVINAVHLKTTFQPLLLSFILNCENGTEFVGIRLRAEQLNVDTLFRQYEIQNFVKEHNPLTKKPVTKWILAENSISFLDIEGRVLSFCTPDSDLYIPKTANHSDTMYEGWLFKEDYSLVDFSRLSMLSCVWAPRLDFSTVENSKQSSMTEEGATKGNPSLIRNFRGSA